MKKALTIIISVAVIILDQIFKLLAIGMLKPIEKITVIDGLLDFSYVENRGMAFGLLSNQRWIFITLTSAVIIALLIAIFRLKPQHMTFYVAAALLIGGGVGNMIDRILYGFVVDYIKLSFFPPVCNFADYCVTAGVIVFLIYLFFYTDFLKSDGKRIKKDD